MAGLPRPAAVAPQRKHSMRPPPARSARANSAASSSSRIDRSGAISPAGSVASVATTAGGTKRKERDFEHDDEETNINVVVRCRGRNEREVRENSGVVLSTDGVKGKSLALSMGPSALSNKTYNFDKVFSSAADQAVIYDDVVTPILDEMLAGYNCTIFAYGQTGTGKTYTMSGDMSETFGMLSDAAGIVPRVLYSLFNKLEIDDAECSVKCSFIELYNEELRDLISRDDSAKLKIYDEKAKNGHSATMVQGMEESHIKTAPEGIKLLQDGSHKRQVAATKCNDLSSRSHTVFTITTSYIKRNENGEDYVSAGKLNLVDLAGSENIQRSGAENKRAAEAGLINRSLLTLGRVINALVERSSHIPYRESKLTRLLQDSLGGRTKTCIIATVSPAKSNLEETISTLDYAFRAKNIRNKPQVNQKVSKNVLLKDFTNEIEKLKSELIAARQRNGVYLTNETWEAMNVENESTRILSEEQASKIEAMEINLRNKVQELYSLTCNFMTLKKEHEGTKLVLDDTKGILEQTEDVLTNTRHSLAEETVLRKAHQETEKKLSLVGSELISTLGLTVKDVGGLHDKNRRKSHLQSLNRNTWGLSQAQVAEVTNLVETRVEDFRSQQQDLMASVSERMKSFVGGELEKLAATQAFLGTNVSAFDESQNEMSEQTNSAKEEMDNVLEEIKTLREEVKSRVGLGLQGLSAAAERISEEVISELGAFHTQLHGSYSSLGRDFKILFEDLLKHINAQKDEANNLRQQLTTASEVAMTSSMAASAKLDGVLREERAQAAVDRQNLLSQITSLVMAQGESQDARLSGKIGKVRQDVATSNEVFEASRSQYSQRMDAWNDNEGKLVEEVLRSRETLKSKLKEDWVAANKHNSSLQTTTKAVHEETVRIVDEQMKDVDSQMQALDDFVTRARSQNSQHHDSHAKSLQKLSGTVKSSFDNIGTHFNSTYERVRDLGDEMSTKTSSLENALAPLDSVLKQPLADLRSHITTTAFQEYQPTGATPQKVQYQYHKELPRTEPHDNLLKALRPTSSTSKSPSKSATIPVVFNDAMEGVERENVTLPSFSSSLSMALLERPATSGGLREIAVNVNAGSLNQEPHGTANSNRNNDGTKDLKDLFKKSVLGAGKLPVLKNKKSVSVLPAEGRENVNILAQSTGRRRSPRTN
ncbi:P-loop containing nucleoside triphosphate hydrolase protein [Amylocarpus encephaloides]|uniref:P-loop containing nucleoside triphosphate hydrolase protein n=1 Tax=Amylocarpus encephaloides TaxID=45428 RepID=A0A9P8C7U1_9HELO|nr:P-loop containing nucleoside triphosphate hydrolase protein [Amylocarpus encephaloides]